MKDLKFSLNDKSFGDNGDFKASKRRQRIEAYMTFKILEAFMSCF